MEQHDFIRDRRNIKWTAMMLTEHKVILRDWGESQNDVEPPNHDEDNLSLIAETIYRAMNEKNGVQLVYWRDKRKHEVVGTVKRIDALRKAVLIEVDEWDRRWVPAVHIVRVDLVE